MSRWEKFPAVLAALASARRYWSAQDPGYKEEVHVRSVTTGAFTQPGVQQRAVLYMMSNTPRCCPKLGLAIVQDGQLVRNIGFEFFAHAVGALPDFDRDGRDEIALEGMFMMGGQVSQSIALAAFGADGVDDLGHTSIFEDACGAGYEGSWAARLLFVPGSGMMVESYSRPTCDSKEWQLTKGPEPITLDRDKGTTFRDIPLK